MGTSLLEFKDLTTNDTGQYRCKYKTATSHTITVTVSERAENSTDVYKKNIMTTSAPGPNYNPFDGYLLYIYLAVGVSLTVVVVITISILVIQGRTKKAAQTDTRYMDIPMSQQALPHPNITPQPHPNPRESPRSHQPQLTLNPECIYDNAPARRPTRSHRAPTPAAASQGTAAEDGEGYYSNRKAGKREEEEGGLLYAALNQQLLSGASARPPRPQVECSEYAAIRLH